MPIKDEKYTDLQPIATVEQVAGGKTASPMDSTRFMFLVDGGVLYVDAYLIIDGTSQQVRMLASEILTDQEITLDLMARTRIHVAAIRTLGF